MTVVSMPLNPITPIIRRATRILPDRKLYEQSGLDKIDVRLVVEAASERSVDFYVVWARSADGARLFGVEVAKAVKNPGREVCEMLLLGPCEPSGAWVLVDDTEVVAVDDDGDESVGLDVVTRVSFERFEDGKWVPVQAAHSNALDPFVDGDSVA